MAALAILHRAHAESEAYRIGKGIAPEARGLAYRAARAVVLLDGRYRERLVLVDVDSLDGSASLEKANAVIKSFGGDIAAGPEFAVGGALENLFNWPVFTIKRRSTSPVDDCLNCFATRL